MSSVDLRLLEGRRLVAVSFSSFPGDPRPRRAAEACAAAGMRVEVICLRGAGESKRESFRGIEIDRVSIRKSRNSKLWYVLQYCLFIGVVFLKLTGRALTRRYHVVHVHNMPDVLVFAALVPKLLGAKIVLDLHDPMPELMMTIFNALPDSRTVTWMTRLERWSIAFSDIVITVNQACKKLFTARSARLEKVRVVMNSPDESIFKFMPAQHRNVEPGGEGKPFVVMYHGTLVERNGLDLAVDAVGRLKQTVPRLQLRVYGASTPYLEQVMTTVVGRGLQDHVLYFGPKSLEQLSGAIAECDVGVIPNKRSIFTEINTPTRIFEYLALGKAVVAPRAPGIEDYFDENSLVYFDLGNALQLTKALAWVATHPDDALRVTQRGQAVYLEHSWSKEKARLLATVAGLVASGRPSARALE